MHKYYSYMNKRLWSKIPGSDSPDKIAEHLGKKNKVYVTHSFWYRICDISDESMAWRNHQVEELAEAMIQLTVVEVVILFPGI